MYDSTSTIEELLSELTISKKKTVLAVSSFPEGVGSVGLVWTRGFGSMTRFRKYSLDPYHQLMHTTSHQER